MLDPFLEQIMILGISFIVVITGGFMGLQIMKMRVLDKKVVSDRIKEMQERLKEEKQETQRWRGKFGKKYQDLQVEGDFDLTSDSDIGALAKMVLPNVLQFLPPEIAQKAKGLLDNPDLVDMGIKLYEKHPEEIRSILAKFIKKASGSASSNTSGSDSKEEITNYA